MRGRPAATTSSPPSRDGDETLIVKMTGAYGRCILGSQNDGDVAACQAADLAVERLHIEIERTRHAGEVRQPGQQPVVQHRPDAADLQGCRNHLPDLGGGGCDTIKGRSHRVPVGPPRRRKLNAACAAHEQRRAQLILQAAYGLADGGLGEIEISGGLGEGPGLRRHHKGLQGGGRRQARGSHAPLVSLIPPIVNTRLPSDRADVSSGP